MKQKLKFAILCGSDYNSDYESGTVTAHLCLNNATLCSEVMCFTYGEEYDVEERLVANLESRLASALSKLLE